MNIQLSDHFSYQKLLRFVFPSVVMMIFTSIYSIVDGLFVSNFVGKTPFAALNLIMPVLMIMGSLGFMIGTGGSAIVAKTLGEGEHEKASQYFSMMVYLAAMGGVLLTVLGLIFIRPVAAALKAEGAMLEDCVLYGRILLVSLTAFILQNVFQSFLVTAGKPQMGLSITVGAGLTNMVLDALFIVVFRWGLAGAAIATAISQMVGGLVPVVYFARQNDSLLRLTKTRLEVKIIGKACANGSSELMSNLSTSLVSILYNFQLMRLAGENGVAAYGVIMYVNFIFIAIFLGYSIGSAPIISYHYGAENRGELQNLFRKSLILMGSAGAVLTALAELLSAPLSAVFVGYDQALFEMTCRGFRLYSLSFLAMGFNIFGSAFFTALNNGVVSAMISFLRTLLFQMSAALILPIFLETDGIWLAVASAEAAALAVTVGFLIRLRKRYHYA